MAPRLPPPGFNGPPVPILGAPIPPQPRRSNRAVALGAIAIVVVLALVGVALYVIVDRTTSTSGQASPGADSASPGVSSNGSATVGTDPALAQYYKQSLHWASCGSGIQAQCASFNVPLDYSKPDGQTVSLTMSRLRATKPSERLGALIYNPGGPGGSASEAVASGLATSSNLAAHFDVIGLDPRGVGLSSPLECIGNSQVDQLVDENPTPETPAAIAGVANEDQSFAGACESAAGDVLPYLGTENAARDMDIARGLLGDDKLYYLGQSYGTYLGTVYAGLFPQRVGRLALDGAIDPALTGRQEDLDQAKGFELALNSFVANCVTLSNCPLGTTVQAGLQRVRTFLNGLGTTPISGDATRKLDKALGTTAVLGALYDDQDWPQLRDDLAAGFTGNGGPLLTLADSYNERGPGGQYYSNIMQVNPAINCVDRGDDATIQEIQADLPQFEQASPTFGEALDWGGLVCSYWPVKPEITPAPIHATGAAPILVVGTTRDPATPYMEAQALSSELSSAELLTWNGDGHTGYNRGSSCIDDAVDTYLITGTMPPRGTTCVGRT